MGQLTHNELEELLGVYALDAVDLDEADELEAHLVTCPRCRDELSAHREVVGLFANTGQTAPAGLWDRITAGMQDSPPELQIERMRPSMVTPETLRDAPVASLDERRRRPGPSTGSRRSAGKRTFVAMAAAAAAVIAVLGVGLARSGGNNSHPSAVAAPASSGATMADVTRALQQKGSRKVVLAPLTGHAASLDAVVTPTGVSYLYRPDLTPLGADRTYQLWGVVGDQQISYGLLGTSPAPVVRFNAGTGVRALAVTDEVASGVALTHQPVVVSGAVTPAL